MLAAISAAILAAVIVRANPAPPIAYNSTDYEIYIYNSEWKPTKPLHMIIFSDTRTAVTASYTELARFSIDFTTVQKNYLHLQFNASVTGGGLATGQLRLRDVTNGVNLAEAFLNGTSELKYSEAIDGTVIPLEHVTYSVQGLVSSAGVDTLSVQCCSITTLTS